MEIEIELELDKELLDKAKAFALESNSTLSELIEISLRESLKRSQTSG